MPLLIETENGDFLEMPIHEFFNALNTKARRNQIHLVESLPAWECVTARRGVPDFNQAIIHAKNAYEAIKAYHGLVYSYSEIDGVGTCIDAFGNAYFARRLEVSHA